MRERKKKGTVPSEQGTGVNLSACMYLALCSRREKINRAVSSAMHSVLQTVPSQDAPDRCFKLKNREGGEGLQGWQINALTDQRERGDTTEDLGKLKSMNREPWRASWV